MNTATLILAAGLGTRMKSSRAKVLHELGGIPLICYPVDLSLALGSERTIAVVGHQKEEVGSLLAERYGELVETVWQKEQLGTGHAVLSAKRALSGFSGYVLILSGDVPLLERKTVSRLLSQTAKRSAAIGLIVSRLSDPKGYGRILRGKDGQVRGVIEHKDADAEQLEIDECNMGIYAIESRFLWSALGKVGKDNAQGEYYLPDLLRMAAEKEAGVVSVSCDAKQAMGINSRRQLAEMEAASAMRVCEKLMDKGITLIDPANTWISSKAKIGQDTVIFPGCRISSDCVIGKNCRIENGSIIDNSRIGNDVLVKPYCIIEDSRIRDGAIIGPFAHTRPLADIGKGCHVGNFVEIKKSVLKEGAKANHLSYIGDATIGKRTNVGAGTITCNYDGYAKYRTVVGDDVLIGSDTQLVAPVKVAKRAVLGAGTSLTGKTEVPAGALVVTRPPVEIKPGYRDRLEKRHTKKTGKRKVGKGKEK